MDWIIRCIFDWECVSYAKNRQGCVLIKFDFYPRDKLRNQLYQYCLVWMKIHGKTLTCPVENEAHFFLKIGNGSWWWYLCVEVLKVICNCQPLSLLYFRESVVIVRWHMFFNDRFQIAKDFFVKEKRAFIPALSIVRTRKNFNVASAFQLVLVGDDANVFYRSGADA